MCLRLTWVTALLAGLTFGGAAFAEVTVSQSNNRMVPDAASPLVQGAAAPLVASGTRKGAGLASLFGGGTATKGGLKPVKASATRVPEISYSRSFLAGMPVASGDTEWECLAKALYFEARGESVKGQFAVAEVILNRVQSPRYPSTICGVVHQGGRKGCQFSFTCDRHPDRIREKAAWAQAGKIARLMIDGAPRALTEGATHFHTRNVRPGWARKFPRTAEIGAHLFYRQPGAGT
ncbi:cell wall hydrolase [Aliigemmobacter aestuarii]